MAYRSHKLRAVIDAAKGLAGKPLYVAAWLRHRGRLVLTTRGALPSTMTRAAVGAQIRRDAPAVTQVLWE